MQPHKAARDASLTSSPRPETEDDRGESRKLVSGAVASLGVQLAEPRWARPPTICVAGGGVSGDSAYLFVVQIVTGILLAFYYQPAPETAYQSVRRITEESITAGTFAWRAQVGRNADDCNRHPAPDAESTSQQPIASRVRSTG
ncbi:MAG: hypothetical protein R3C02_21125 [Planctomycetaceae bacterium]